MPVEQAISVLGTILPAKIVRFVESQIDLHSTKVKKCNILHFTRFVHGFGMKVEIYRIYLHLVLNKILYSQNFLTVYSEVVFCFTLRNCWLIMFFFLREKMVENTAMRQSHVFLYTRSISTSNSHNPAILNCQELAEHAQLIMFCQAA